MSPFLAGCTWLLVVQCAGELLVRALALPVPGPVLGMALLFALLAARGDPPPTSIGVAADALARHLSLLFVPAGVGVMLYAGRLAHEWLPIAAALIVSTLAAIAVAAWVFARLAPRQDAGESEQALS